MPCDVRTMLSTKSQNRLYLKNRSFLCDSLNDSSSRPADRHCSEAHSLQLQESTSQTLPQNRLSGVGQGQDLGLFRFQSNAENLVLLSTHLSGS